MGERWPDALGLVETSSMAVGHLCADRMLKTSRVRLLLAESLPGGKLLVAVWGGVAEVESATTGALDQAGDALVDALFIPRLHPDLAVALAQPATAPPDAAIGMIETRTVAACIRASDAALKAARVGLVSLRLGAGIGGRAIAHLAGDVADVGAAVEAGKQAVRLPELLIHTAIVARPHEDWAAFLAGKGRAKPLPGLLEPGADD